MMRNTVATNTVSTPLSEDLSTFVGRQRESEALRTAIGNHRLVTVTGPHGVGRSRLIRQIAISARRSFPAEPRVLLSPTADDILAEADRPGGDSTPSARGAQALLLLDDIDGADSAVSAAVVELLNARPSARVLVSSVAPLDVPGERLFPLEPFLLPSDRDSAASAKSLDAVALFVDRARALEPEFSLSASDVTEVVEICRLVDGLPSLIELAARATSVLGLGELKDMLRDSLQVLESTSRAGTRNAVDAVRREFASSSPAEQSLWRCASAFSGSFDLSSLAAVCQSASTADIIGVLTGLRRRSVVLRDGTGSTAGFRLLRLYREVGQDAARESETSATTEAVLRTHLLRLAADASAGWYSATQAQWIERLTRHQTDLVRLIVTNTGTPDDARASMQVVAGLRFFWQLAGLQTHVRDWLARAIDAADRPDPILVRALQTDAYFAAFENDIDTAVEQLRRANDVAAELGTADEDAFASFVSGVIALGQRDLATAERAFARSIEEYEARGDRYSLGEHYFFGALLRLLQGDPDGAERLCAESLKISAESGERQGSAYTTWMIALATLRRGESDAAIDLIRQSIVTLDDLRDTTGLALCAALMASIASSRGEYEKAARLMRTAVGHGYTPELGIPEIEPGRMAEIRDALGGAAFDRLFDQSARFSPRRAIEYAMESNDADSGGPAAVYAAVSFGAAAGLSARELEIGELVSQGLGNPQIAAKLFISRRTVEGHVQRILTKLDFHSRSQIAVWFAENRRED
jgi:non-specific serine/threonine protein kinase